MCSLCDVRKRRVAEVIREGFLGKSTLAGHKRLFEMSYSLEHEGTKTGREKRR